MNKGFTLIELLVVVLIIGILVAIALPQYKKVIEKSKMAEAVIVVKAIAQAQQGYYLIHEKYADCLDLDQIDVDLSGTDYNYHGCVSKKTSNFIYTSNGYVDKKHIALAQRIPVGKKYYIRVGKETPNRINCVIYSEVTPIQKELCEKLNKTGTL